MIWLRTIRRALRELFLPKRAESDLDEELRTHLALQTEANMAAGMNPELARYTALRAFGGIDQTKEQCRELRPLAFLRTVWQDLRFGVRTLSRSPGFTIVAILTLALGIGATTAIFTVVDSLLLNPLPYRESSRLVSIFNTTPRYGDWHVTDSLTDVEAVQSQAKSFDQIAWYLPNAKTLSGRERAEGVFVSEISNDFFRLLGADPVLGRFFTSREHIQGNGTVAVLSNDFWKSHFGQRSDVLGQSVVLDDKTYTIVGVASKGFNFPISPSSSGPGTTKVWIPLDPRADAPGNPHFGNRKPVLAIARLRPGANLREANTELATITARLRKEGSTYDQDWSLHAADLTTEIIGDLRPTLLTLLGAAALVLLIVCANISSLLFSLGWQRQKEIAIRIALGASGKRLLGQLMTESILLASLGGAGGVLVAFCGVQAFRFIAPPELPRMSELHPNWALVWFSAAAVFTVAILFGLMPALQTSQVNPSSAVKEGALAMLGTHRYRLRSAVVIVEIALAVPLAISSVLLAKSLYKMTAVPTGMQTDRLLWMNLGVPLSRFKDRGQIASFTRQVLEKLHELPMVESAAVSDNAIFADQYGLASHVRVEGNDATMQGVGNIEQSAVTSDYFATLGIPVLQGRAFMAQDTVGAPRVAVINEKLAKMFWPNRNPIGTRMSYQTDQQGKPVWITVVGVVADTRDTSPASNAKPEFYTPYYQWSFFQTNLLVRTRSDPDSVISAVRERVWSVDKSIPLREATVKTVFSRSMAQPRFRTLLISTFAVIGVLLALIGIYGVVSYSVVHRTHEIGIRMALGATPLTIATSVVSQALKMTAIGMAAGLILAISLTRLIAHLLYGVEPTDPVAFLAVVASLIFVAAAASYIPARRAATVDPMKALRSE